MSVVIDVNIQQARQDVQALNADIMNIAASAAAVKSAFGGTDFMSGFMAQLQTANAEVAKLQQTVQGLNQALGQTDASIKAYTENTRQTVQVAQQASQAILGKVDSLQKETAATTATADAVERLTAAEARAALTWTNQEKVLRATTTAAQKEAQIISELNDMYEKGMIAASDYSRYQEIMASELRNTGTAAEVLLMSMQKQNAEFLKSRSAIIGAVDGYATMTKAQRETLQAQAALTDNIKMVGGYFKDSNSIMQEYNQKLMAIHSVAQASGASQQQLATAVANLDAEFMKQLSSVKAATEAMQKKAYADSAAAAQEKKVQDAINATTNIITRGLDPVAQYAKRINDLNTALAGAATQGGGRIGITQQQYQQGLRGAREELERNIASSIRATGAQANLNTQFGLGAQAAAGFRAGLQGAGLSFGIFTSNTIVAAAAVYGFSKAVRESLVIGADFQQVFTRAAAMLDGFDLQTRKPIIALGAMQAQVMGLSETTRYSSSEISQALISLGQAGYNASEAMKALPTVLNLATVGELSTEDATTRLINVLTAFGMRAEDAAGASDKLAKASLVSTTTIGDLMVGLGQVSAVAHQAGVSFEETLGALASMRQAGIQASKTGTDLRNIIQSLAAPTSKASELFNKLNIDTKSFYEDGALNLTKMLTTLRDRMSDLSQDQQTLLAKEWFGRRSATGFSALIASLADAQHGFQAMTSDIRDSEGASQALTDILNNNAKTAFEQLGHVIQNIAIQAFQENQDELTAKIREFADYIKSNGPQIADTIAKITQGIVSLTEMLVKNGDTILGVFVVYEGWRTLSALVTTTKAMWARAEDAYTASVMRNQAAVVENTAAANGRAVTGSTRLLPELEAEVVAFNAQAAAAGRSTGAMAGSVGATTAAAGAMGGLRAAGAGLVAMLGGWPVILTAAALGVGYLAYTMHESSGMMETDIAGTNEAVLKLNGAMKDIGELDYSGLRQFRSQLEETTLKVKEQTEALKHNIEFLEQAVNAKPYMTKGRDPIYVIPEVSDATRNALKDAQRDLEVMAARSKDLADNLALVRVEETFKLSAVKPFVSELDKIAYRIAETGGTIETMSNSLSIFFFRMREQGAITKKEYDDMLLTLNRIAEMRLKAASAQVAADMGPPAPAKPPGGVIPGGSGGASEAASRQRELNSELEKVVNAYNKATGAAAEYNTQLQSNERLQEALSKGKLRSELEKLGISAEQAKAALDWQVGDLAFDAIKDKLVALNPAFKVLTDGTKDLTEQSGELSDAYAVVDQLLAQMIAKSPQAAASLTAMADTIRSQIPDALNGNIAAINEFNSIVANAGKNLTSAMRVEGLDQLRSQVEGLGVTIGESEEIALASAQAIQLLGGNSKAAGAKIAEVTNGAQLYAKIQQTINTLLASPELANAPGKYDAVATALRRVAEATPQGALEKQNQNLKNQIAYLGQGSKNLELYNILWQATSGHLEEVTDGIYAAAQEQMLLNEQFERMKAVEGTFRNFAESLGDAFGKFFMNTRDGWDDLVGDIKSSFKRLLQDLITQAITNQILFYFGFNQSGWGGGGGSMGGLMSAAMAFMGLGGGGGGGSNDFVGSLVGAAAANNAGYTGAGGPSGGGSAFGSIGNLYSAGRAGYQYATGTLNNPFTYANGRVMPGSSYFGSYVYGPTQTGGTMGYYSPTALGYGAAVGTGLYMGYQRYQDRYNTGTGIAAGATYAVGGTALALGMGSMMAGGSFAAGVGAMGAGAGAMGASAGAMAAIPIIGWIALILMAIDMISGGQLFGTSANKFVGGATNTTISDSGAAMTGHYTFKGQKPLFGGAYYREKPMEITPEMQAQADQIYRQIHQIAVQASRQLGVDVATGIEGDFEAQFDKKGEVTKTISTVLGKTYEEPLEDFVKRMQAENIIALVDKSIAAMGGTAAEATRIAEVYRFNAQTLLDAAQVMLQAQTDIKNGQGLLRESGGGVLTDTMTIVQALQMSGETLAQTYGRLLAETRLVDEVISSFGGTLNRSGTEFVQFADDFVQLLGGLDQATQKWNTFATAVFGSVGYITEARSSGKVGAELAALGLDATITIEEFAEAFREVSDSLDATALAAWVQAGADLGAIQNAMLSLQGMADGIDIGSMISQQQQLVASVNQQISMAAALGASEEELARMRELGQQAISRTLNDFMGSIDSEIAKFEGGDWLYQLEQINIQMRRNIDSARALGATEEQLARIQKLAAYQTAQLIAELEASITSLVKQLHGVRDDAQQSAGNTQTIADQGQQAIDQAQRDLYSAAQNAIEQITEFLNSLETGPLSTQDWQGQLTSARTQFDELVAAAQGGDVDAMQQLTDYAQTYLQHAQDAYGNSVTYGSIFDYVTGILENLQNQFEQIEEPPDATGGGGGGGSSASLVTLTAEDKYQLSLQIAQQLGALGVALDTSVWDLMDSFGVTIGELASNLGINLNQINEDFFKNIMILASALHVDQIELLNQLGATPAAIGAYFQVTTEQINAGNLTNIQTMAEALGISVFEAITYMGGDLALAIAANGIDINSLDPASMLALGEISRVLGVDILTLLKQLGVDVTAFAQPLADSISTDLAAIPGLADATIEGMQPLLLALAMSLNEGDLASALGAINEYLDTLPEDQRVAIEGLFTQLGIDLDSSELLQAGVDYQETIATNTGSMSAQLENIETVLTDGISDRLSDIQTGTDHLAAIRAAIENMGEAKAAGGFVQTLGGGYVDTGSNYMDGGGETAAAGYSVFLDNLTQAANSAGEQLYTQAVSESNTTSSATTAAAEETAENVQMLAEQVSALNSVVATKLDQVNQTQGQTRDNTKKIARQGKINSIKRHVK